MAAANRTQAFLGDESTWSAARVELSDVQWLWGGRRIFVPGTGYIVVQQELSLCHSCALNVQLPRL